MTDRHKAEAARIASEARGYTVQPNDLTVTRHDTARDLLDAEIARGAPGGTIGWWARLFACEIAAQRGEDFPDLGTCIEYENALTAAARSGHLTMRPPRASTIAEAVTPETTDTRLKNGLVALKSDMRAYAQKHAPGLLGSDLLAEAESAPAVEDTEPGTPAEQWQAAKRNMRRKHELADSMVKRCQSNKKKAALLLGTTTGPLYRALNWKPQHCDDSSVASVARTLAQLAEEPHKD